MSLEPSEHKMKNMRIRVAAYLGVAIGAYWVFTTLQEAYKEQIQYASEVNHYQVRQDSFEALQPKLDTLEAPAMGVKVYGFHGVLEGDTVYLGQSDSTQSFYLRRLSQPKFQIEVAKAQVHTQLLALCTLQNKTGLFALVYLSDYSDSLSYKSLQQLHFFDLLAHPDSIVNYPKIDRVMDSMRHLIVTSDKRMTALDLYFASSEKTMEIHQCIEEIILPKSSEDNSTPSIDPKPEELFLQIP